MGFVDLYEITIRQKQTFCGQNLWKHVICSFLFPVPIFLLSCGRNSSTDDKNYIKMTETRKHGCDLRGHLIFLEVFGCVYVALLYTEYIIESFYGLFCFKTKSFSVLNQRQFCLCDILILKCCLYFLKAWNWKIPYISMLVGNLKNSEHVLG